MTREPMTQEQLDAIQERIDETAKDWGHQAAGSDLVDLLAEVYRLRAEIAKAREVTDEKVERAALELYRQRWGKFSRHTWGNEEADVRDMYHEEARAVLTAALGGGDDA